MASKYKNIALFVDIFGYKQLKNTLKHDKIACVVVASNRNNFKRVWNIVPNNIPVLIQPNKKDINKYKIFISKLKLLKIDFIISNSYSMLITEDILSIVKYNSINIHWSLLPKNRGPNPMQWAIIKNEKYTGITIHKMDNSIDTGAILIQKKVKIKTEDTWVTLRNKLILKSKSIIKKCLVKIINGNIRSINQNNEDSSVNFRLDEEFPLIDFKRMSDLEIYNLIRAQVMPLSGAYIHNNEEKVYFNKFIVLKDIKGLRKKYG